MLIGLSFALPITLLIVAVLSLINSIRRRRYYALPKEHVKL